MPTTTNYGWTTPADTDLVKDGASAIRTLGTAIDTTVFNNAGAAIAKTIVDAKGDIIAATAADTVARLAVGSNDQVLTADSSTATGLKWATPASGGMTSIASGSLSGASLNLTSISGSYKNLVLYLNASSTPDWQLDLRFNGDTGTNYYNVRISDIRGSMGVDGQNAASSLIPHADAIETGQNIQLYLTIVEYANTTAVKNIFYSSNTKDNQNNAPAVTMGSAFYNSTSAITSITSIDSLTGDYTLYGVK